jgi:hypothetical protein
VLRVRRVVTHDVVTEKGPRMSGRNSWQNKLASPHSSSGRGVGFEIGLHPMAVYLSYLYPDTGFDPP